MIKNDHFIIKTKVYFDKGSMQMLRCMQGHCALVVSDSIMKELGYDENAIAETCPNTERMFYHSYTHLPLYPLTRQQLEYQAAAVVEAVREMKAGK